MKIMIYLNNGILLNNRRDKLLLLATTWMNLKTFMYAEAKRQEVKYIFYVCIYEILEQAKLINDDSRSMVAWDMVFFFFKLCVFFF